MSATQRVARIRGNTRHSSFAIVKLRGRGCARARNPKGDDVVVQWAHRHRRHLCKRQQGRLREGSHSYHGNNTLEARRHAHVPTTTRRQAHPFGESVAVGGLMCARRLPAKLDQQSLALDSGNAVSVVFRHDEL
eukprot:scaffold82127_cov31-Tisochrysis_lutea.AAC.3